MGFNSAFKGLKEEGLRTERFQEKSKVSDKTR